MKRLATITFCVFAFTALQAQQKLSTAGRDFWMAFMENTNADALTLYITAGKNATVTVAIPAQGFSRFKSIGANSTDTFILPNSLANNYNSEILRKTGVHITSDVDVNVFALNLQSSTTDAATILPTNALGRDVSYIITSFAPEATSLSECIVVATEDNTVIEIIPSAKTRGNVSAGSPLNLFMKQGETYQLQGEFGKSDLTGTTIRSLNGCKTFAVFQGATCANVPRGKSACDHLFQQCYPINTLGKAYVTMPFKDQKLGYVTRIVAVFDSTAVQMDNTSLTTMVKKGQYYDVDETGEVCHFFTADKAFYCSQLMKSNSVNGSPNKGYGDPSLLSLSPIQQSINKTVLTTVTSGNLKDHYLNILVKTAATANVLLDGTALPSASFSVIPVVSGYSYTQMSVANGTHTIQCDSGFIATTYGIGPSESYAYMVGASFENVNKNFVITYSKTCDSVIVTGNADTIKDFRWLWGDGNADTGRVARHMYSNPGNYTISMVLLNGTGCTVSDTLQKTIAYYPVTKPDLGRDTAFCKGIAMTLVAGTNNFHYRWNNNTFDTSLLVTGTGTYMVTKSNDAGCSAADTLVITDHSIPANTIVQADSLQCYKGNLFTFTLAHTSQPDPATIITWDLDDGITKQGVPVSAHYTATGVKSVSVVLANSYGCRDTLSGTCEVYQQPGAAFSVSDTLQCLKGNAFVYSNKSVPGNTYHWYFGDGQSYTTDSVTDFVHHYTGAGAYNPQLITTDKHGCADTFSLGKQVVVVPDPTAVLNAIVNASDSGSVTTVSVSDASLNATGRYWRFGDVAVAYGADTTITFISSDTVTVFLKVYNQYGCTDAVSRFLVLASEFRLFIPDAFSPNGDGLNEVFRGVGSKVVKAYTFSIYNRWGQLVFRSDGTGKGWDGTFMGALAEQDVYMYKAEATDFFNKQYTFSGTFHLIR